MKRIFLTGSPYTTKARFIAIIWTLLILIGCFFPAKEIPKVDVPMIDKWTHFVLFGGFTFLWLCAKPSSRIVPLIGLFTISLLFGSFIEVLQGMLSFLGRSMELMDAIADAIGGAMGIALFRLGNYFAEKG
jgi:VanZ family protein